MAIIAVGEGGSAAQKAKKVLQVSTFLTVVAFISGMMLLNWRFKIMTKRLEAKMSNQ